MKKTDFLCIITMLMVLGGFISFLPCLTIISFFSVLTQNISKKSHKIYKESNSSFNQSNGYNNKPKITNISDFMFLSPINSKLFKPKIINLCL